MSSSSDKFHPTIIGIYGISGSGKSYLQNQLKTDTALEDFAFYDGSGVIDQVTDGGLAAFKRLNEEDQTRQREAALDKIFNDCKDHQKTGVVSGHYIFWNPDGTSKSKRADIKKDWETYTHMVYLNTDPDLIARRRRLDTNRGRQDIAVDELSEWQNTERNALRATCLEHSIFFSSISENVSSISSITLLKLKSLLLSFHQHTEVSNPAAADKALDIALGDHNGLEKVLVLDADKTLAPQDTGAMFWKQLAKHPDFPKDPLSELFSGERYSYTTFRQALLYYEEVADVFDTICDEVVANVVMYPEMVNLLTRAAKEPHVRAIVVTCGHRKIWEKILIQQGLSHVKVVGSGSVNDGYVITGAIKGRIVDRLQYKRLRVLGFGDSPLDIDMLKKADQAYVVVGKKDARSRSMDMALRKTIAAGLNAHQIIFPESSEPRLDLETLPLFLLDRAGVSLILKRPFLHATDKNVAKLFQTPTRNANIAGHELRQAHERIGYYLAMEYLSKLLGVEEYKIPHVQGHPTEGFRFRDEAGTLIVPLMRGGEPMVLGVSQALKTAGFAHAYNYKDFGKGGKLEGYLEGKKTIILVDSVINSGKSILEFLVPLRESYKEVRVIVVAGVVHAEAVGSTEFGEQLHIDPHLTLVALRKSDNKYTGTGVTDTGHRLFNTTWSK